MTQDISWPDAQRRADFEAWIQPLAAAQGLMLETLAPASADASFRRYLRVQSHQGSRVVMDAPPPLEDVRPFVHVAGLAAAAGLHTPRVLAADTAHGFLLLTDLGQQLYLPALLDAQAAQAAAAARAPHGTSVGSEQAQQLMQQAVHALVQWQQGVPAQDLPPFDRALLQRELDLFPTWCVKRHFGLDWDSRQQAVWQQICELLIDSALAQPQVAVHADWMPRNLMLGEAGPGILDFQDAVRGPISYDLASLLRDAFISWPEETELDWAVRWWQSARAAGLPAGDDFGEFWRGLEWMGLQRHLKVMGIFCRLQHRDGKPRYAQDLPRFFDYATRVASRYRPLIPLLKLLEPLSGKVVTAAYTF